MKLVIDIPEEWYRWAKFNDINNGSMVSKSILEAVGNGVPVDTCENCVSRKELLKKFTYDYKGEKIPEVDCDNFPTQISFKDVKKWIRELPSVEPERKSGKVVFKHRHHHNVNYYTGEDADGEIHKISVLEDYEVDEPYCSECGKRIDDIQGRFCVHCGVRLEEEV